jgi:4,5-dihydroxyphthalate decarboxylase
MRVRVALAVGDYDLTRPLIDGTVTPRGVDLTVMTLPSPQRHWRMVRHREFDAAELSLSSYVVARSRGQDDLVAIPVFPHRRFRHGYVFLPASSDVDSAAALAGGRIGLRSWKTTAGVWLRGILSEHHGLPVDAVTWVAQDAEEVAIDLPGRIRLDRVPAGTTVTDLCAAGELAALLYPELPRQLGTGIRRLFADPKAAEQRYFRDTGIFPIMHLVALRAELAERHPWLPDALYAAFDEARRLALAHLADARTTSVAWLAPAMVEERAVLGPDPWAYGLTEINRTALGTFLGYAREQGIAARDGLTPAGLFHPTTVDTAG